MSIKDETMQSLILVSIPRFIEKVISGKTVTFFEVSLFNNYSKISWVLEKRYSEFHDLHIILNKLYPKCPQIPGKTFLNMSSVQDLNKRRVKLEEFLTICVRRKDIMNSENFRDFIQIDKHAPEISSYAPIKLSEFSELPLGLRDFIYLKIEKILFVACSDMNIASRIDAYITNVNFPWEKKTDSHITVGAIFAFRVKEDSSHGLTFEKLWAKSYPIQVLCY